MKNINLEVKRFFSHFKDAFIKPEMSVLPGQLAFFIILSFVPVITLIGYAASFFNISVEATILYIENSFGGTVATFIAPIIGGQTIDTGLVIMFIVLFYIASNGADSLIITSNRIFDIKGKRWFRRRIKAVFLTMLFVLLYLFVLLVPAFGSYIIDFFDHKLQSAVTNILPFIEVPISWLIIFLFIKLIYRIAPDNKLKALNFNRGAITTATGWVIITYIYSFYVNYFAVYDIFYAGLSNIAILMLWIYLLSVIFVVGMSLNYYAGLDMEKTGTIEEEK